MAMEPALRARPWTMFRTADLVLSRSLLVEHLHHCRRVAEPGEACQECVSLADDYADVAFEVGVSAEKAAADEAKVKVGR